MEHKQLLTVFNSLPVGIGFFTADGTLVRCNESFCRIFGADSQTLLGNKLNINENSVVPDVVKEAVRRCVPVQMSFLYDFDKQRTDKRFFSTRTRTCYLKCNGNPLYDNDGKFVNYIFIFEDITETVKSEEVLRQSRRKTELAMKAANIMFWEFDAVAKLFYSDNEPLNGYDQSKPVSMALYLETLHPDDRSQVTEVMERMSNGEDFSFSFDSRVMLPDSSTWQFCKMRKNYIIKDARRILAEQIRDNGMNTMNKNPITNATGLSAIIPKDNDGYCTVYKMDCEDGLGLMTVYQVYTGIQLIYNDFEATSCYWDGTIDKNVLEINHCREGREGSVLQSGSCLYLGEGDLSIHTMDNCASEMAFPLRHYRGISVVLDLELVSQNPPGILAESGIGIADFKNKFCADGACFVMRAKDEIEHIFSELYSVPDCLQKPYFMLKVQELLLFLCMVDVNKEKQRELYTSPQVEIVRDIHKRLISNLQERPTIEELSKEYLINTATLKDTFKGVYGQPIGTYMKVYRMKQAAALLRQTQATIAEIASQVGYENQSKFATAFRDVMKIAPAEYRKQNSGD